DRLARALQETEIGGVTTNLPFLRWLVRHPLVRAGRVTTAFLAENPPLSEPPRAAPDEVWSEPWRVDLPPPPPPPAPPVPRAAPPAAGPRRRRGCRCTRLRRARAVGGRGTDAGHGDPGPRRAGREGCRAAAARRARGDEDGDAARLAVRGDGARHPRRRGRP